MHTTRLSVNVNKIATLRNARGGNNPNLVGVVKDCERFGAQGITVHPRPDERHIRGQDVLDLSAILHTEFNIEGYPDERYFRLIEAARPAQATLVPDGPDVLTSNAGWDTVKHADLLKEVILRLKSYGTRVSLFVDPDPVRIEAAAHLGADRVELYTEAYARGFHADKKEAIRPYLEAAQAAQDAGLGLNAGHDLDLHNLAYFAAEIPGLLEVSIGHALVCDALYYGFQNTIGMYLRQLAP
jgi:pyridoxine 5-phosphate synthase